MRRVCRKVSGVIIRGLRQEIVRRIGSHAANVYANTPSKVMARKQQCCGLSHGWQRQVDAYSAGLCWHTGITLEYSTRREHRDQYGPQIDNIYFPIATSSLLSSPYTVASTTSVALRGAISMRPIIRRPRAIGLVVILLLLRLPFSNVQHELHRRSLINIPSYQKAEESRERLYQ